MTPSELFSEGQARALVACPASELEDVLEAAERAAVPAREIGETGGAEVFIRCDGEDVRLDLRALEHRWSTALPKAMEAR